MKLSLNNIRNLVLTMALTVALSGLAQDVTYEQAVNIAAEFFKLKGINAPVSTMRRARAAAANDNGNSAYYIINSDNAFAIVAGDSRASQILAYSLDDAFDADNVAPGAAYMLEVYEKYMQDLANGDVTPKTSNLPPLTEGKFLNTATWNQNPAPWWDACPSVGGKKCVAGCVATAMSIVMRHHCWPASYGYGSKTYTSTTNNITSTADFANTDYQIASIPTNGSWSNMVTWTDAQRQAVATLLHHAGVAASMDYDPTGSGALDYNALYGICKYFGYKMGGWARRANYASDDDYLQDIINDIDANLPTMYSGVGTDGGHMFVCDGYDTDYKLHFNFGWSGKDNGYYSIAETAMDYYNNQSAIIGIIPDHSATDTSSPLLHFVYCGNYDSFSYHRSGNKLTVGANLVFNSTDVPATVKLAMNITDANDNIKQNFTTSASTNTINPGSYWYELSFVGALPDNYTYVPGDRLSLFYSADDGATWHKVERYDAPDYIDLSVFYDNSQSGLIMIGQDSVYPGMQLKEGHIIDTQGTPFDITLGYVYNYTDAEFNGDIAIFVCDSNDNRISQVSPAITLTNMLPNYYVESMQHTCTIASSVNIESGYRLVAFYQHTGSDEWTLLSCEDETKYYLTIPDRPTTPTSQTVAFNGLFATFCSPYDLDFNSVSDFCAYTVTMLDSETLMLNRINELKSGVGVLLMGNNGLDNYSCDISIMQNAAEPDENLLVGVLDDTMIDNIEGGSATNYTFKVSPTAGFYYARNELVKGGQAYMRIPRSAAGAPMRFVFMPGDDADGIFSVTNDSPTDNVIYNMQGIKVDKPTKGIYIINGKKVIIR